MPSTTDLRLISAALETMDLDTRSADIAALARAAELAGASSTVIGVLLDGTAPEVVRRRALGRIGYALERVA